MITLASSVGLLFGAAVVNGYCNWGMVSFLPVTTDECFIFNYNYNDDDDDSIDSGSGIIECSDNGDSATYYAFNTFDCSGDIINMTELEHFDCNADLITSCNYFRDIVDLYLYQTTESECDGSADSVSILPLAILENAYCVEDFGTDVSITVNFTDDISNGIDIDYYYYSSDCSGSEYDLVDWYEYFCDNRTLFYYEARGNNGEYFDGSCNWGRLISGYPIAAGYCASFENDNYYPSGNNGESSVAIVCDPDDNSIAYEYVWNGLGCEGTIINITLLNSNEFMCDKDNCDTADLVVLSYTYEENNNCTSNGDDDNSIISESVIPFPNQANACVFGGAFYWQTYFNEDSDYLYISFWSGAYCTGTLYGYLLANNNECNDGHYFSFTSLTYDSYTEGDCNYATWDYFSVATDYCISDSEESVYLACYDDYAVLFRFDTPYCDSEYTNYTYLDTFHCGGNTCEPDDITLLTITEYDNNDDCDNSGDIDTIFSLPLVSNSRVCMYEEDEGYFYGITVSLEGLRVGIYLDSNCSQIEYYNVTVAQNGDCDDGTLYEYNEYIDKVVSSNFNCDFGTFGAFPLVIGICNDCFGNGCNGAASFNTQCNNGINTLYEYFDDSCSSSEIKNETVAQFSQCVGDSSEDCTDNDMFTLIIATYPSEDCSGTADTEITLNIASGEGCFGVAVQGYTYYYLNIESSLNGIYIDGYFGDDCNDDDGRLIFNQSYEDGLCQNNGENSTLYGLFEYTGITTTNNNDDSSTGDSSTDDSSTGEPTDDNMATTRMKLNNSGSLFLLIVLFLMLASFV